MTNNERKHYQSPFSSRYASDEMQYVFSEEFKFRTWRRLWIALAESEQELGLPITDAQLAELKAHAKDINYAVAEAKERELRHDVMSHVHAFAEQAPEGGKILHLGATSCFIGDNTELIMLREALKLTEKRLLMVLSALADFAETYRELDCLGFTHYQPAQITTVGKRASLWLYDFYEDFLELAGRRERLLARSTKGTTGTQASFLKLFGNDSQKVQELERKISSKLDFPGSYPVTGQTYPRKIDSRILASLSQLAQSAHKFGSDIRLLSNLRELEEPFGSKQIGSSAMAYKRNPMRCERICSLSRFIMSLESSPAATAANQWLERTLDDSANRRIVLAEAFLATDTILILLENVIRGLIVNKAVIKSNIQRELPFMITENLLMEAVERGGDRQELHEIIRSHSHEASRQIKEDGATENRLLDALAADDKFPLSGADIENIVREGHFSGRAAEQVAEFLQKHIQPLLKEKEALFQEAEGISSTRIL